ncbi:MAG: PP2C family protein-serine/threonine phosphatase [Bacteroidetes bacterium]|nr:PP2C family protein-serine/threonine phosphatase [Bacteroidota bacterium]
MRLKKILLLAGAFILSVAVFILNAATKNIDLDTSFLQHLRTLCNIFSFGAIYLYLQIVKREKQRGIVQGIGSVAVFAGIFLTIYLFISFLPWKGFETRDLTLFPRDYQTILFSSIFSIVAGIYSIVTLLYIKDLVLYKRKKATRRNFIVLIASLITASLSQLFSKPLEDSVVSGIFTGIAVLMIVTNSFRLAWIAYLPRKEKIYSLLYSLLSFFGFLVILIVFSQDAGWAEKGIHYYSPALFTFVQLTSIFGAVYFGMSFSSTLFHLPTAEAFDRKQTEISSLHNLSRLINQVFDLKDLAETATKMTTEVVQATSVWLEIIPTEGSFHKSGLMSHRNIDEQEINVLLSGGDKSVRMIVCQTKKVLMIDDMSSDKRTKHLPKLKKTSSLLIVPLLSHQNVIGILYATKEIEYGFDQDDVDILSGFADQVAIAIENARLIERSFEKERLQRELMLAQEMQKRLLPQELPVFDTVDMKAISSPALEVGGDYYDIVRINDRLVGIVIGDVSGKGVGAAFYMAEVKGIFQSLAKIFPSPSAFMIKANEALVTSIDKRSFISLIYSTIDIVTGELIVARAGHCPMLYISSTAKEYIRPQGLGLGMRTGKIFDETIEEKKIMMKSGDVCVFYTDGVTESRSSDGDEFGYERLLDVVDANKHRTAEEIKEAIIQTVWQYTDAQGYHDDLTIFVVKWN